MGACSNKNPIIDLYDAGERAAASFFGALGTSHSQGDKVPISQVAQLNKSQGRPGCIFGSGGKLVDVAKELVPGTTGPVFQHCAGRRERARHAFPCYTVSPPPDSRRVALGLLSEWRDDDVRTSL